MKPTLISFISRPALALALGALALSVQGQGTVATGTVTPVSGSGPFTYAFTLTDSGSSATTVGSVWYAWTPGFNYLPSVPSSTTQVTPGWTTSIQGSPGHASIQFVASSSGFYLQPGQSATFDFTTADSSTTLAGNNGGTPIGTSVAYSQGLFSSGSSQFVAQSAPEPSALVFLGLSGLSALALRRVRT